MEVDHPVAPGEVFDAIDELVARNRQAPDPQVEQRLVSLRHRAFAELADSAPVGEWPPPVPDRFPDIDGLPELPFPEVTPELLASAVVHHGALLARGLFPPEVVRALAADVDATMDAVAALGTGEQVGDRPEWFSPFSTPAWDIGMPGRMWVVNAGTVWVADSPRTCFDLVEAMHDVGLAQLVGSVLGERPAMSVTKFALRRVPPDGDGAWHQDSFLGEGTRTINVWIALSACGEVAPGLDVVPRRFDHFVDRPFPPPIDYVVAQETVDRLAEDTPVVRPAFEPGDALIFDQFLLHQTGAGPGLTEPRLGFECWFFAPSTYPEDNVALVV